jgi:hypothetical protein
MLEVRKEIDLMLEVRKEIVSSAGISIRCAFCVVQ